MESMLNLDDYLVIAKRRVWYLVIPFLVVSALTVPIVNILPPVYRASATVAVESQQIREDLVKSTVTDRADEGIAMLEQRIMTTRRLLDIIDEFKLFPQEREQEPEAILVAKLRERIFLERIRDKSRSRRSTIAFKLGFEHRDPQTAAAVADKLVTIFLAENVKTRTARATETTAFLKQESTRLAEKVATMDAGVAAYKQEHGDALPEHLEMRMNMLQAAGNSLGNLERDILALEEDKRLLEVQLTTVGTIISAGAPAGAQVLSPAQQLAARKAELAEKSAIYTPAHPDLRGLKRMIAQLEKEIAAGTVDQGASESGSAVDPARAQIESKITSIDARLASLRTQKQGLQTKIESLQAQIIETPQVERGLKDLTRDYKTALKEYNEISTKLRTAELAQNLETEEKAERFVLLEAPKVPSVPIRPNKLKLYGLGLALALGSGVGTAFLAETLDTTIRGSKMLISVLQHHPLAVIPFIERPVDRRRQHFRQMRLVIYVLAVLVLALAIIHFFYRPLDVLAQSLLESARLYWGGWGAPA